MALNWDMSERERSQISTGWKDITLKIFGTNEKVTVPVMISSRAQDVKNLIAEMHGGVAPHQIELVYKSGPTYRRHRNGDEINSNILVKGIKSFSKGKFEWNHPFLIIGAGHMGLRQALHWTRMKLPFTLMDRYDAVGGNAWLAIANKTSKLQTEGPQYQLQYDVFDGNIHSLLPVEKYGYWPSRDEILAHFREICDQWGATPNIRMSTEVVFMSVNEPNPCPDLRMKDYDFYWKSTRTEGDEGVVKVSCLSYYPGCLVVPHRKTWPGEEVFDGQIGYGFSHEFDYTKLPGQDSIIIGMGAFAHENVRTVVEHGGRKVYNIARHFNLMMPRLICWWINQSTCPPTAAMVLHAMKPMYDLIGMNPWNFFSVTSIAERTVASIKQYTRWGISDIYFLAIYFDKLETVQAEVKRFKPRAAVLNNGRIIEDLDHVIKVIGFDGDFGVDRLMQTRVNIGPWPNGDFRRFTLSDQSAIDASRFTNIAISPAVSSMSRLTTYYFEHPECAFGVLGSGMLGENESEPEIGSPAYHYEPRKGTAMMMLVGGFAGPGLGAFEELNNVFKKASLHHIAGPEKYQIAIRRDWVKYCRLFKDQGCEHPWPDYPYSIKEAKRLVMLEEELRLQEEAKMIKRMGGAVDPGAGAAANQEQVMDMQAVAQQREQMEFNMPVVNPGDHASFEPARRVLQARIRSASPARDDAQRQEWLAKGHEAKAQIIKSSRRAASPKALGN